MAGVLLLVWLFYRIGLTSLLRNLSELGWGFLIVFGLHSLSIVFNAGSWRAVLSREHRQVHLRSLALLRVAGDAVNVVAPTALVGGELVRVSLLSRRVPTTTAAVSVMLTAMSLCLAQILFVVSGIPIALSFVHSPPLCRGLELLCASLAAFFVGILVLAFSRPAVPRIGRALGRIPWLRSLWASHGERWGLFIGEALHALREEPGALVRSIAAAFLAWQAGVVETFVILRLLRVPIGWPQAYSIEVLSVAIEGVLFFVPAKMGTQEGGKVLIFLTMGLDPAKGLALGFIRRLRELAWAIVGLGVLGSFQRGAAARSPGSSTDITTSAAGSAPP